MTLGVSFGFFPTNCFYKELTAVSLQTTRTADIPVAWKEITARYQTPNTFRSLSEIATTLALYAVMWIVMYWSLGVSYLLTLVLSFFTALFKVRVFVIMHDCGHGSFFKSQKLNDRFGAVLGVLVFTPFFHWKNAHAMHHATSGNLDRRGFGDVWMLTVEEYRALSPWRKLGYRIYRHPAFLFLAGAPFNFLVIHRTRFPSPGDPARARMSVHGTTLALLGYVAGMISLMGWREYLLVQAPVFYVATIIGVWLFYVQHQFKATYWRRDEDWNYTTACFLGSSFYKLPRWLAWWTGNIGIHHIHHLSPKIPSYRLPQASKDSAFAGGTTLTLWTGLESLKLRLWDEKLGRMVGFKRTA